MSFRRAPSRRNPRQNNTAVQAGVIIQHLSFTVGGGKTVATFRCLSGEPAIIGSDVRAVIGYWFLTGYFGGPLEAKEAESITAGVPDPGGVLFGVVFDGELSDEHLWTMAAPSVQSAIRGNLGGKIVGMLYTEQEMGGFTAGQIPIMPNEGNPVLPELLTVFSVSIYSATSLELLIVDADGNPAGLSVSSVPVWTIDGINACSNAYSSGAGQLVVEFPDPIGSGSQLVVPAWGTAVRGLAGAWIEPLRRTL